MERTDPGVGTPQILKTYGPVGHLWWRRGGSKTIRVALLWALGGPVFFGSARAAAAQALADTGINSRMERPSSRWWYKFASGFAASVLAHEGAHVIASYAMGGRPTFGLNAGRPTIYSGIDAILEPRKQFVFSSAGLT